ncbi:hypothetical protein M758_1G133200 [Ceratodon purpureus]|nr:hypothetical protein M758_1G133200 [Ceratodon purpureus]
MVVSSNHRNKCWKPGHCYQFCTNPWKRLSHSQECSVELFDNQHQGLCFLDLGLGFMEDSEAVAAPASAEETTSEIPPPSPSPSPSTASPSSYDPLAKALQTLFLNVTTVVQGELQAVNSEYELLERMNLRVASEHDHQAKFAQGLRVFVENLKEKNDGFSEYIQQIDEIDQEVTELEALVSTLDNYTSNLESKLRIACARPHGR